MRAELVFGRASTYGLNRTSQNFYSGGGSKCARYCVTKSSPTSAVYASRSMEAIGPQTGAAGPPTRTFGVVRRSIARSEAESDAEMAT